MTVLDLSDIYDGIIVPTGDASECPLFAVRPVPAYLSYFIGKDGKAQACLLVAIADTNRRKPPPIRLESLDAQFELVCQITKESGQVAEGRFTVVRCRSQDPDIIKYFLSICKILIRHLGDTPSRTDLAAAVQRIASIFQSLRKPSVRSLNGLFGELFLISRSHSPSHAVAAWRINDNARFDFSVGDIRLDVKTSTGRLRQHTLFI